jgi:hypothetical protein
MKWVRPIITFVAMGGLTAGFFMCLIPSETYVPLAAVAIVYWFKSRDESKAAGG